MSITCNHSVASNGVYSTSYTAYPGKSYTFSAFVYNISTSVQLAITDGSNTVFSSAHGEAGWERLEVTYTNDSVENRTITLQIRFFRTGSAIVDCVQLETSAAASRYNLLENADLTFGSYGWIGGEQSITEDDTSDTGPAPTLAAPFIEFYNNASSPQTISQTVNISGNAKDTFVFGGWTCKSSLSDGSGYRSFIVAINNNDGTQTTASVSPNPHIPNNSDWQYILSSVTAIKPYSSVTFTIKYGCDPNHIYVDGLQLFREPFAETYVYNEDSTGYDDGNVDAIVDITGNKTEYTYDSQTNDLISVEEPTGIRTTYTYDGNHRVTNIKKEYQIADHSWSEISGESFTYDAYGNVTKHTYRAEGTEQNTTYSYTSDGNFLSWVEDSLSKKTYYGYNTDNSTLEWIQYPNDTSATRQEFEYDKHTFNLIQTYAYPNQDTLMYALYDYTNDRLTEIETDSTLYELSYNDWGQRTIIKAGGRNLATYTYTDDSNRYLSQLDYGNGNVVKYVYDDLGRMTQESYYESGDDHAPVRTVTYAYDSTGALATTSDSKTGRTTKYYYDTVGRVNRQRTADASFSHNLYYTYDALGQITEVRERYSPGSSGTTEENLTRYAYANGRVTALYNDNGTADNVSDDVYASYTYDSFDRVEEKTIETEQDAEAELLTETLTYNKLDQVTTLVLDSAGLDRTYTYEYDGNGNITKITWGGKSIKYTYDSQNQLIREDNPFTEFTWMWTYDEAGNILSKSKYSYSTDTPAVCYSTIQYGYTNQWGDLLTSYDGKTISYDAIGNPLSDGTWTYTWEQGRQLVRMSYAQNVWNFTYDSNGMRTGRSNAGTGYAYTYTYNGSQLSRMTCGSNVMRFTYGADGKPLSINYNGTTYYYVTNLQGDVIAILNSSGTMVVEYTYDAWGNPLTTTGTMANTLGLHNPLRYRGYVYDRETGLYYLQSRYYNPEWGRFINADGLISAFQSLSGNNLFTYCYNNPVCFSDDSGAFPWLVVGIIAACAVIIGTDHALAANQPEGGYAVGSVVNQNGYKRGLYAEGSGFVLDDNGISLCDLDIGLFEAKLIGKYLTLGRILLRLAGIQTTCNPPPKNLPILL